VDDGIQVTWLGHACVLVQMDKVNILTDPVFSQRASFTQMAGPKRYRKSPCTVKDLPTIQAVVISHNHYDHLDYQTVLDLNARFGSSLHWFVPLEMTSWFNKAGCTNVTELDWWEEKSVNLSSDSGSVSSMKFVQTPAQHWSQRGMSDRNKVSYNWVPDRQVLVFVLRLM